MNAQQPPLPFWRLEAAAGLVRLSPRRVRGYVRSGLVRPASIRGAVLMFGEAELARLRKIRRLIDVLGVNAAGAEIILRLADELAEARQGAASGRPAPPAVRTGGGGAAILPFASGG